MTGPANPSRRAFLTGRTARPATRPGPGLPWLAGVLSAETCGPCDGPCVAACPEGIVARLSPESPAGGVAWLDFRAGACTLCGACTEACPAGGSVPADGRGLPPVVLDEERCLAAKGVVCIICVARCPERALSGRPGGRVTLTTDSCSGCGACIAACPASALASPGGG